MFLALIYSFGKIEVRVSALDLLGFDFGSRREGKTSKGLLGYIPSHRNQVKARKVKKKAIRGRSKSPREATIVVVIVGQQNFGSTGKLKIL